MSGPFKRRPSLRRPSMTVGGLRRGSATGMTSGAPAAKEVPWDLLDRCLLPVVFCHASAVIISTFLNVTTISQVSAFSLFIWFTITTIAAVLFYHNLKVRCSAAALPPNGQNCSENDFFPLDNDTKMGPRNQAQLSVPSFEFLWKFFLLA